MDTEHPFSRSSESADCPDSKLCNVRSNFQWLRFSAEERRQGDSHRTVSHPEVIVANGAPSHHLSCRCRPRITMLIVLCPLLSVLAIPTFSLADLRSQMTSIVVGLILVVVGIGALALFFFRSESRDLTLIYFSLFSILYALRLLLRMPVVRS